MMPRLEFGHLRAQPALDCGGLTSPYGFPLCGIVSAVSQSFFPPDFIEPSFPMCGAQHSPPQNMTPFKAASSRRTPRLACGEQARAGCPRYSGRDPGRPVRLQQQCWYAGHALTDLNPESFANENEFATKSLAI
jgi:hypothetical protein